MKIIPINSHTYKNTLNRNIKFTSLGCMPLHNSMPSINMFNFDTNIGTLHIIEQARLKATRQEELRREQEHLAALERQKTEEKVRTERLEAEKKAKELKINNIQEDFKKYKGLVLNSTDEEQISILKRIQLQINDIAAILSTSKLDQLQIQIQEECQREEMMQSLEKIFTRGFKFYTKLQEKNPYDLNLIKEVQPNPVNSYKNTLRQMTTTYLEDSNNIEPAILAFDDMSTKFFEEAAKSIKEIFALKTDNTQKWLERIPKLGLIAKALRVGEQIRLTKCLLKDYSELTEKNVSQGIQQLINKYNAQYNQIKKFIEQHPTQAKIHKNFTQEILNTIENARQGRLETYGKKLDIYSKNGMNISNICYNIKKKGGIELATKALFTLAPLF